MNFEDQPWRAERACAGENPRWWTSDGKAPQGRPRRPRPGGESHPVRRETDEELQAKHICWTLCPVREACLDASEGHPGIWGGLDEWERSETGRMRQSLAAPFPTEITKALGDHSRYVQHLRSAREMVDSQG